MGIIAALIIGGIAGWLAGLIVRGAGFGLIGNITDYDQSFLPIPDWIETGFIHLVVKREFKFFQ